MKRRTVLLRQLLASSLAAGIVLCSPHAAADEGMWLFNRPPIEQLESRYGFTPTQDWLDHLQKASVRVMTGGSASVVSPHGLVMTNHHVAYDQIVKVSTPQKDLMRDGFLAKKHEQEIRCPDIEMQVLQSIEDVTDRVNAAVKPGMSAAEAGAARQAARAEIEKQSIEQTGLHAEVVTLYGGARYHLYRYKRYTDVRLVFCPDEQAAAFGGDIDNFEFPRYCLDATFFRLYEDGKPANTPNHLRVNPKGAADGDLVFVTGHPGRTQRGYTAEHIKFLRDTMHPAMLRQIWRREVQLQTFSGYSDEHKRIAADDLGRFANARKAYTGFLAGLHDPSIIRAREDSDRSLKAFAASHPQHAEEWSGAWDEIESALQSYEQFFDKWLLLQRYPFFFSDLVDKAVTIVQMSDELSKPNGERLKKYRDSNLESLRIALYSSAPMSAELEIDRIASTLSALAEIYGADDPLVAKTLAGRSPRDRATELVRATSLFDVDSRRKLTDGGTKAVHASKDPLIRFALDLDADLREIERRYEDEYNSIIEPAYAKIVAARFASEGERAYPDATFTLRLAFGAIKGCYQDDQWVEPFTVIGGIFDRWEQRGPNEPFSLPRHWIDARRKLKLNTPYNNLSTCDIIGGNSGSPLVDRDGRIVGLIFDGNRSSFVWGMQYEGEFGRAVSVDIRGMLEAMKTVYKADALVKEMTSGS